MEGSSLPGALELAAATCVSAGRMLQGDRERYARTISAEGRDIKLRADFAAEEHIVRQLSSHSTWPILSEEAGWIGAHPPADELYWVVDPLDGSFNYARGIPFCCTAIALCAGTRPLIGVVYDFNRDEVFSGEIGRSARLNGQELQRRVRLERRQSAIATGFPVAGDASDHGVTRVVDRAVGWKKVRMLGSAALSIAYVAAGRLDHYHETGILWWDVAAALAVLAAAGGIWHAEGAGADRKPLDVTAGWAEEA